MASKMIAKDAKASLFFLRSSILAAARPKTIPSHGELDQALLRISTQKPLAEAAVLRRSLYKEDPSMVRGVGLGGGVSDGRIWGLNSGLEAQAGRGPRRVVNEDEDDDDDDDRDDEVYESEDDNDRDYPNDSSDDDSDEFYSKFDKE